MSTTDYSPFNGDGRSNAYPPEDTRPGTRPIKLTYASARAAIDRFLAARESVHSDMGATLWVIEAWARHQGRKIEVEVQAGPAPNKVCGYIVRLVKPAPTTARESMADKQDARALIHLQKAIRTARDAADNAERALKMYAKAPGAAVASVLNALAWGHANAASSIETAMACVDDAHKVRALEADEAAKAGKA